jgi:2-methylfumaryl-CoA hydratase
MTDWTDPETFAAALEAVTTKQKGNHFEEFTEGETIEHAPGLGLSRHASELWAGQTLNHDPMYWRTDAARARGFEEPPVHPDYLLAAVMGPSVEDLSEKGGYFLGRDDVVVHDNAVYPGTDIRVESTVESKAASSSRPDYGIVTWRTRGIDTGSGDILVSYERTNMVPRREPLETDGGGTDGSSSEADGTHTDREGSLPVEFLTPEGPYFEDFAAALATAGADAAVAYRHERGRTMDDPLVSGLPLSTLNTARQHHNRDAMADSPSGEIVAYGDVTRSVALGHARSDEATYRELEYGEETFHDFVTLGDTVYGFTRVLEVDGDAGPGGVGRVKFEHIAFNQREKPVYSGTRAALIERRG